MPTFQALNRDWSIRFDGLLLGELRDAHGIDLADVGGESWVKVELDQSALTQAVCFLCRDQANAAAVTARQLADAICGEVADNALECLWGAAKLFFRPKLLSALQSACAQRREMRAQWEAIAPLMQMLNQPELPESIREAVTIQLAAMMEGLSGGSRPSQAPPSASGPVATPLKPATDSPALAELAPAA